MASTAVGFHVEAQDQARTGKIAGNRLSDQSTHLGSALAVGIGSSACRSVLEDEPTAQPYSDAGHRVFLQALGLPTQVGRSEKVVKR